MPFCQQRNRIPFIFFFLFRKPFSFCVNSPHIVSSATELNFLDCITKTPFCLLHPQPPIYLLCSQISFSMLCCCPPMWVGLVLFTLLLTPIFYSFFRICQNLISWALSLNSVFSFYFILSFSLLRYWTPFSLYFILHSLHFVTEPNFLFLIHSPFSPLRCWTQISLFI